MEASTLIGETIGCGTLLIGFAGVILAVKTGNQAELRREIERLQAKCEQLNSVNFELLRRYVRGPRNIHYQPQGDEDE